ncbi:MFS transporter [Halobacillus halophilus]|uniref:MFS transporter n=1 Tax=Halobacillus halophilus TaxID=1570 RepID=UPI001CD5DB9F|nr:MFS transporter [Halobacillus halophilus]MCA1010609.1 MFS transporter [Halobacillus halophilus]
MYKNIWFNKNIRYYLLAGGISRLGDNLSGMAFLFLAYDLTKSSLYTTIMAIAETAPYLLFGLIGGVIADWLPKKKLLIYLDLVRVPIVLSIVGLYYFEALSYVFLLIVSFLIQSIGCFFNPAHRSVLPSITREKERTSANSLNDTLTRGVTVLTPVLTVWLLHSFGAVHLFTIDALTYGLSAILIARLQWKETNIPIVKKSIKSIFRAILEFMDWAKNHSTIKKLFIFTFITVFFNTWVWEVGLLLALTDMTSKSEELYSILQGVFGGIVILTNLVLPYFIKAMNLRIYLVGAILWGLGIAYYGAFYGIQHFFIGVAIVGIGLPIASLARVYLLQTLVPEEKMGRAFSTNAVLLYFSNTISLGIYGLLVSFISIQTLMLGSGLIILLVSIGALIFHTVNTSKLRGSLPINLFK